MKLEEYLKNDNKLMDNIIHKAKDFINNYSGNDLIKEIYENKYINKNSIDINLLY